MSCPELHTNVQWLVCACWLALVVVEMAPVPAPTLGLGGLLLAKALLLKAGLVGYRLGQQQQQRSNYRGRYYNTGRHHNSGRYYYHG